MGDVNNMPNEKTGAAQNSEINLDELRRQFDTEARYRDLLGWQGILITAIAVAMSLFHFYTSGFGLLLAMKQGSLHLAFVLVLVFYCILPEKQAEETAFHCTILYWRPLLHLRLFIFSLSLKTL